MRVTIDDNRCQGHGRCYALAPEFFEPDDLGDGRIVGDGTVPEGLEDSVRRAVLNCPEEAISIDDGSES